jgi:2-polyprenyl-3-methyl-5-hydroxy-6-metoxy-1,4-benzoquinol methylase
VSALETREGRIAALGWTPDPTRQEEVRRCNLCDGTRLVAVSQVDRYGFDQPAVVCAGCGLGFLSPRLTASAYADFYRTTYRPLVSAYHGRTIDAVTVQDDQREYATELVAFLRAALPASPAIILDVGGSTGVVAGAVRDALGGIPTVLDPAPEELAVAAEGGAETIEGFAEDLDTSGRTWDLVLLCQTVDHLLDVRGTLEALRAATVPDGHAFIDILDLDYALEAQGTVEGVVKVDHPYYLTRTTAEAFFSTTGFRVVAERLSHDGHWGFLLAPGTPAAPDPVALRAHADRLLRDIWRRRAAS